MDVRNTYVTKQVEENTRTLRIESSAKSHEAKLRALKRIKLVMPELPSEIIR